MTINVFGGGNTGGPAFPVQRSVRLRSSASAYFNRSMSVGTSTQKGTQSFWLKRGTLSVLQNIGMCAEATSYPSGGAFNTIQVNASDNIIIQCYNGTSYDINLATTAVYRDPSAWYHIVVAWDTTQATAANRCILYVNGTQVTSFTTATYPTQNTNLTGWGASNNYTIGTDKNNSNVFVRFFDGYYTEFVYADGQQLTPSSFGSINATTGVWQPIKYTGTYGTNGFYLPFTTNTNSETLGLDYANTNPELITNGMFTANVTGWTNAPFGGGSPSITWQSNHTARIANSTSNGTAYYQAITTVVGQTYYAQALVAAASIGGASRTISILKADNSSFSVNNITVASIAQSSAPGVMRGTFVATATTTYIFINVDILGTGTTGADISQISVALDAYKNSWNPFNISTTAGVTYDSMLDVPTLTSANNANFAVMNPLDLFIGAGGTPSISNGNLRITSSATANSQNASYSSIAVTSGKWYFETTVTTLGAASTNTSIGMFGAVHTGTAISSNHVYLSGYVSPAASQIIKNGSAVQTGLASITSGDVIGVAYDATNTTCQFYRNGSTFGSQVTGITADTYQALIYGLTNSGGVQWVLDANFGQRPFTYTPPSGFKSLNTYNLPAPTIPNGATQFATNLWTGTGASQSITNTVNGKSFQPDLVWVKSRSNGGYWHGLIDSVRGSTKILSSNTTGADVTLTDELTSFNSNGFSLGASLTGYTNNSGTYVGWQWKAGGTAVTNTSGSITSSVSANPSAGFSIVTYTGTGANATVGHGLGVAPKMVIFKTRSIGTNGWPVYHASFGNTGCGYLNNTGSFTGNVSSLYFNNTSPTSTVFTVGSYTDVNNSAATYVAYCFSEIAGYSKFGSYTGNGSTDGPFVYCGFRPRWIMVKRTDSTSEWYLRDTSRDLYNVSTQALYANQSSAETTSSYLFDLNSNGFKLRSSGIETNASGGTYIYAAFAESPFNYSLAR